MYGTMRRPAVRFISLKARAVAVAKPRAAVPHPQSGNAHSLLRCGAVSHQSLLMNGRQLNYGAPIELRQGPA